MTAWLLSARWWQVGLVSAVPLGVVLALVERFARGDSWTEALALEVVAGLLRGGVAGALTTARLREDADGMPSETYARVERATRRGPVPESPEERAAAHDPVLSRPVVVRASRTPSAVLFSGLALLTAVGGVTRSPWWWVVTGVCVALVVVAVLVVPRRLERRAELLAEPPA